MSAVSDVLTSTGKNMTKYVTTPIVGLGIAAAKVGGDFEEQMSRVKAISGATGTSFEQLRDQAIELGAKTAFSAKESAAGMENLASAGFDANEIMEAMPGLLDLAAVSGGDVALASENAATALRGFGLEADQAGHVADVFARAAADTNAEVADMGEAMKYIAPVANAMGLAIEETAAAVGIMSDAGVKGSQAGTTLRGALSRLARPSDAMRNTMDNLGVSFYDAEGNMKSLQEQVGLLKTAFKDLTPEQQQNALVTLYGQESLSGMMALIDKGPDALGKLTDSLRNSDGAADEMARTMQDNMNSSLEQMMGAFESAAIVIQEILAPAIKNIADSIAGLVEKFVAAPKSVQTMIVTIGLIVAAIGPLLLILGHTIKMFMTIKVGLKALGGAMNVLKTGTTMLTGGIKALFTAIAANPIVILIAAIVALVAAFVYLWNTNEDFRKFWIDLWETVKKAVATAVEWITGKWDKFTTWFSDTWSSIKKGADNAFTGIKSAPGKAADQIKSKWSDMKGFFSDIWSGVKENASSAWGSIAETVSPYVSAITEVFQPMITFFSDLWSRMASMAGSAWEIIKTVVMGPILLLTDLITGDFTQLKEDAAMLWQTLSSNVVNIVTNFVAVVAGYYTALKDTTINIWNTIVSTIKNLWGSFTSWLSQTTDNVVNGVKQGWNNLKQGTIDSFNSAVQAGKNAWQSFKDWMKNTVDNIVQSAVNGWNSLKQWTINTFNNTVDGAKQAWSNFKQGVMDLVNSARDTFDQLRNINLLDIGRAIMDGFFNGLKSAWSKVQDFVGGIGDWIREHKGPMRVDKKLLIPAGNAIMNGLNKGLIDRFGAVQSNVGGMAEQLAAPFSDTYDLGISSSVSKINKSVSGEVTHQVNMSNTKQPATFNIRLGNQQFKAFVDDISQAQGNESEINLLF